MSDDRVIIAGGGIGGLATALTLQQIGALRCDRAGCRAAAAGINLQLNAVRELLDLGFTAKI